MWQHTGPDRDDAATCRSQPARGRARPGAAEQQV